MHSTHCGFHTKEVGGTCLVFQKRIFQGFISGILRVVNLLGEMFFSSSFRQQNLLEFSYFLFIFVLSFPVNVPEQFEVRLYFKYLRSFEAS